MPSKKYEHQIKRILKIILISGFAFFLLKYLLPVFLPFILALVTARLMENPIRTLQHRLKIKRTAASVICALLVLSAAAAIIIFTVVGLIQLLSSVADSLPEYLSKISSLFRSLEEHILTFISTAPPEIKSGLSGAYDSIIENASLIPGKFSSYLLDFATSTITNTPEILLFTVTYTVSVFFFASGYPIITGFIMRQIPDSFRDKAAQLKSAMFGTVCIWLRSQFVMIGITFVQLSAAFLLLGISSPIIIALLVTLVDALPVLGTGTILIPWAILSLISGNSALGAGLAITYAIIYIVRSFLEPKIVSAQIGLHPLAALCAAYVGFRLSGIAGMIASPLILMILKVLNDNGIIKLWKNLSLQ